MKSLKSKEISKSELSSVLGGKYQELNTSMGDGHGNTLCDIHYDDNDNGTVDADECIEIV